MTDQPRPNAVLQLHSLGVTYPQGVVALRSVDLTFHRGEFTVLLGRSGAGKSTLLRSLNHLVQPTAGQVVSARTGRLGSAQSLRAHRRSTAMIFQHHHLIARHTALQSVLTGRLAYHGFWRSLMMPAADVALAAECLARVGLADKLMARVDRLSGGQRQRVGIARALAQQPQIVLADEPVASLDPATAAQVLELLRAIGREVGITMIVSLHQLDYARQFADRIIGLADASVVFDGPPDGLGEEDLARIYHGSPSGSAAPERSSPPAPLNFESNGKIVL